MYFPYLEIRSTLLRITAQEHLRYLQKCNLFSICWRILQLSYSKFQNTFILELTDNFCNYLILRMHCVRMSHFTRRERRSPPPPTNLLYLSLTFTFAAWFLKISRVVLWFFCLVVGFITIFLYLILSFIVRRLMSYLSCFCKRETELMRKSSL